MTKTLRAQIQADLTAAIRRRDRDVVSALRTTLAAISNAEAVDNGHSTPRVGVGANDVERRALSSDEIADIVIRERDRLRELSAEMGQIGQQEEAARLHTQAAILDFYLAAPPYSRES